MSAAEQLSCVDTYSTISFFSRANRASFCVPLPFMLLMLYIDFSVYQWSMGYPWEPGIRGYQAHHSISWKNRDETSLRGIGAEVNEWLSPTGRDYHNSRSACELEPW